MKENYCDVLVIGGGAAGFSAAVTAAWHGQKVVLIEKSHLFGGATCWSGGWMWIPRNSLARKAGIVEDIDQPRLFLKNELKDKFSDKHIDMFLTTAPTMVDFFAQHTALQFEDGNKIADIHGKTAGAAEGGRSVIAAPYHGRHMGKLVKKMLSPKRETSFLGLPIMAGKDLWHFLKATRSFSSALYVAKRLGLHLLDLLIYRRTMRFANGSALIARLAKSAEDLGVEIRTSTPAKRLIHENDKVTGAIVKTETGEEIIHAKNGIILAAGGFSYDIKRRASMVPHLSKDPFAHWPLPPSTNTGDTLKMAEVIGAEVSTDLASAVAWCPVSVVPYKDGSTGIFPHIIDRGKPGVIAVLKNGKRFVNEGDGYYDYASAMDRETPEDEEVYSWLICSHECQRRYGFGMTKPAPFSTKMWEENGYLKKAETIEALAQSCNIDPTQLRQTLDEYNKSAYDGKDPLFNRGSTPYNQKMGDPNHTPNPSIAPIDKGPFYAIKVLPGSFGTFAGLKTDELARVLHKTGTPIQGLYAVGTDMSSIMGGYYPTGGINLGPAMTFGYIAGCHIANKKIENS
ncbi:FAD-dependent oxidoreductase [Entomomonas moraniae]|uniref:FAD-dependent oxidoreductase n=1 Tax=Entomomonas moraniae TaxID=2213226 RepID=A0A3Q9JI87_9GAMM|nr:FAD-dependent oxidoreductase [Entomomonas moraniae]AZS50141.1 FAD-dependent oxidoreductase [Entomomonas moraniae]